MKEKTPMSIRRILIILLFTLLSCEQHVSKQLSQAESLLHDNPVQSLALIQTIDPQTLRQHKTQAYYALIVSAALDKNYIDVKSDSLINQAVNYYDSHHDRHHSMLAWYYEGIVLKNNHSYPSAIVAFDKADKLAEQENNQFQRGLIHRNIADIFNRTNNNVEAIRSRKKAIHFFKQADAPLYLAYAELALAIDLFNTQDLHAADSVLRSIQSKYKDHNLLLQSNLLQANILVKNNIHLEEALALYQKTPLQSQRLMHYAYRALAFDRLSQIDSAEYWFLKGYSLCRDQADSATLDYMKSKVVLAHGQPKEAYFLVDHAASVQDSLTRVLLQQSVSSAQRDYYKSETLLREEKIQSMRQRTIFGIVFGILLISLLAMSAVIQSRKKDQLLQKQMARLALEERELERVNRDNAHLVGSLFSEKIDHLDRLSDSYFKMDEGKDKELAFKQIKELVSTIRKDDNLFLSLEKDLDRYCNGIMSKLSSQVPRISGDNRRIIALFFAGYSYEIVKLILNKMSVESLKTARSRFRKEIKESGAPDTDLFLKMLEMKKRPQIGTNENIGDC